MYESTNISKTAHILTGIAALCDVERSWVLSVTMTASNVPVQLYVPIVASPKKRFAFGAIAARH